MPRIQVARSRAHSTRKARLDTPLDVPVRMPKAQRPLGTAGRLRPLLLTNLLIQNDTF